MSIPFSQIAKTIHTVYAPYLSIEALRREDPDEWYLRTSRCQYPNSELEYHKRLEECLNEDLGADVCPYIPAVPTANHERLTLALYSHSIFDILKA
jgi:hypothetical protein